MAIYPKTYDEVMHFKRCLVLRNCIPEMDDDLMEKIFVFTMENAENRVLAVDDELSFLDRDRNVVFSQTLAASIAARFTRLELWGTSLVVTRPYTPSNRGGYGFSGGDGGSSGNNNNNNNNNNG